MQDGKTEPAGDEAGQEGALTESARHAWESLIAESPFPPGHAYSPYPSEADVKRASRAWLDPTEEIAGIDVNTQGQLELLEAFKEIPLEELPFPRRRDPDWRFHLDGSPFPAADALLLSLMIRHLRPARIVEVGVGYSSALMLDTNERFFDNAIEQTFIDPYPEQMLALLRPGEADQVSLIGAPVQDVPLSTFEQLEPNDILFVDSSHVSKAGSDVNHLVFEVFPRLAKGVHIHVHDIGNAFEYPIEWIVEQRRVWSEAYVLRAFLQHNSDFRITLYITHLWHFHREALAAVSPELVTPAGSIWFNRVAVS
jgi:methyltransferase family protein